MCACSLLRLSSQFLVFGQQLFARLGVIRIDENALDRTDFDALRGVEMPNALGAKRRRDLGDAHAERNRPVRTYRS